MKIEDLMKQAELTNLLGILFHVKYFWKLQQLY